MATWLIEYAIRVEIKVSPIKNEYLNWFNHSLENASNKYYIGYSWNAYKQWYNRWSELKITNQTFFIEHINSKTWNSIQEIDKIYTKEKIIR